MLFIIAASCCGYGARYADIIALTQRQARPRPYYPLIESPTRIRVGWKLAIPDGRYDPSTAILAGQPSPIPLSADAKPQGVLKALTKVDDLTFKMTFYERPAAALGQIGHADDGPFTAHGNPQVGQGLPLLPCRDRAIHFS